MRELPTGTVTLLFSDIEGSTRLLHEFGDRYGEVLEEHRRLLREAFTGRGGVEVDTQGDAFFYAFPRASDAVLAAAEAQRALVATPVRVRVGIHTGEPSRSTEGYVGADLHRAARIMAAAHGGQVLVSEATRGLVADLIRDIPRTATVTATTDVELLGVERDDFLAAVTGYPPSAEAAENVVAARLAGHPRTIAPL